MKKNILDNKWMRGAIPALLLHLSIGAVYCWSLLKGPIAEAMSAPVSSIEFAFTLAIFFLGMSAAFGGKFVEKNVKVSSFLSVICYVLGLVLTAVSTQIGSTIGVFLSYGVLMGIGLGLGYLSPVKTLMLWFKENKGLATGIAICGFGLSKAIFSPFIEWAVPTFGIINALYIIAGISAISMGLASYLIKKPSYWVEDNIKFSFKEMFQDIKNPTFLKIWLMFFINITCGLCIIGFEKNILLDAGLAAVGLISAGAAIFNAGGRFFMAMGTDHMRKRKTAYIEIFLRSAVVCVLASFFGEYALFVLLMLFIINFCYGGGFSCMPALLTDYYSMKKISTIHGYALSAWAWASVAAFIITQVLLYHMHLSYDSLFVALGSFYVVGYILVLLIKDKKSETFDVSVSTISVEAK